MIQEDTDVSQAEILGTRNRQKRQNNATEQRRKAAAKKRRTFPVRLVLRVAFLGAIAIGGMIGLQYLQGYF